MGGSIPLVCQDWANTKAAYRFFAKGRVANLGAYLPRATDPPPGNMVIRRGLSRLADIELGTMVGTKNVGN